MRPHRQPRRVRQGLDVSALDRTAFVAVQKIRHEVLVARPDQVSVSPWLTVKQAAALLRWIDKHLMDGAER